MIFGLNDARALDAADPLAMMRDRFVLPKCLYLDGNSLGPLPRDTAAKLTKVIEKQWGQDLIASWNSHDWISLPQRLGALIAPLIGATPEEVLVSDTTSANLFKLIGAAAMARPERKTILSEPGNFPTDLYVAEGAARMLGDRVLRTIPAEEIIAAIDEDVALVLLTHIHYKSGRKLDMAAVTAAAHAKGTLILWDLSHSTGAVELDLSGCGADLAVGCGYKYLNGGPGAPAFLFVSSRLQKELHSPLSGWMGHDTPFAFEDSYRPASGIARFLCGTPPVLGMAALESGLSLYSEVELPLLFAKGTALGSFYISLMDEHCGNHGFTLASPRDGTKRGSHVSYAHEEAFAICQALIARGVVGDFRAPDILRMGFTPLCTSFEDVWRAVDAIVDVMAKCSWDDDKFRIRAKVT